ncbi:MAG TPA: sterol desaturase family protein [Cyclobacteriaceae bacterium]|nr:sterol desaturase family protein [Cyclobacteriaceae bacterium]
MDALSFIEASDKRYYVILAIIFLRYLILASIAFSIFYWAKKNDWFYRKIQQKFPLLSDYRREFLYSVSTAVIFAALGYLFFFGPLAHYTMIYKDIHAHSMGYFVASIGITLLLHDTYFYWMHRLIHRPRLYGYFHKVHHLSINPSPWAAMAFHPLEAVLEFGIIVIVPFIIPIHPLAIGLFLLIMMIYNVYGHLGYELYPRGFSKTFIGKWVNTSVNHNQHHQFFKGNYGLYFLWWDRWMGTLRQDYDESFEEVTHRQVPD